jgi:hypothetical protein
MLSEYEPEKDSSWVEAMNPPHNQRFFTYCSIIIASTGITQHDNTEERKKKGGHEVPNPSKLSDHSHRMESWIAHIYSREREKIRCISIVGFDCYANLLKSYSRCNYPKGLEKHHTHTHTHTHIYIYKGFLFKMAI